jgi:hypothetical protein
LHGAARRLLYKMVEQRLQTASKDGLKALLTEMICLAKAGDLKPIGDAGTTVRGVRVRILTDLVCKVSNQSMCQVSRWLPNLRTY